jgi:hypothetical protein
VQLRWQSVLALAAAPAAILVAGCGGRVSAISSNPSALLIHAQSARIDTNTTTRYTATLADGQPAKVRWSVSGGDPNAGAGSISSAGLYTPPHYLTRESVAVEIHAQLEEAPEIPTETAALTVTPGFLQPLTPGNLSIGPGGTATITGSLTEVGGSGGIDFTLANDPSGTPSLSGSLAAPHCTRGSVEGSNPSYTVCTVTYTAPTLLPASKAVYVLGSVSGNPAVSWTRILLNASGISSNPASHQSRLSVPVLLGSSSSNNADYDASLGQLADCCGGTLGSLVQDSSGTQYVLSNNHVLARTDQSLPGETIIQPGLIDNGCTPYGVGPGTTPVASLTGYPALNSAATNVDAAIARVTSGAVDPKGSILELGARQPDGTLAPAPPGISSTNGKGETAALGMIVAKSGRTTGLTCAAVSAISVDLSVDYFSDCAETRHAFTKHFTNQIAVSGASFSDAGDSGALVVDTANAEPVGLFFAGGTDSTGIEQAIASPAPDVLTALDAQVPGSGGSATSYSFVGGPDHPVACLNYGLSRQADATTQSKALAALSPTERQRAQAALPSAQTLLNTPGIARIGIAASSDSPAHSAVGVYLESGVTLAAAPAIPTSIAGIPTVVIPAESNEIPPSQPRPASLNQALAVKRRVAAALLHSNSALFGIGVGQSLDNPADATLVLFADRHKSTASVPTSIEGQRVRLILMDRFHVTRSHATPARSSNTCALRRELDESNSPDLLFSLKDSLLPLE